MDITTLSLAKKYANKVAAGFSKVEVQGNNLIFTLNDGTKATMTIPTPEKGSDGISIVDVSIDIDGSLLCHMSDGSTINAGKITEYDLHSQELDNKIIATRNELERVKNDVLETGTDTDTYIHLEDSAMAEYQELSVDGVCEQKTTSGSNLCNLNVVQDSRVIYNSDGTITINGEGGFTLKFSDYTFKANTTYYMKWELVSGSVNQEQIFLVLDGKFFVIKDIFAPFKFDSDTVKKGFWIHDNALFTNAIIKIWFSETQTDFEPYTGGQPSPSPDYPQPISVIENSLKITSTDSNIFDITNSVWKERVGVSLVGQEQRNSITITGSSAWSNIGYMFKNIRKNTNMVLSANFLDTVSNTSERKVGFSGYGSDNDNNSKNLVFISTKQETIDTNSVKRITYKFNSGSQDYIYIRFWNNSATNTLTNKSNLTISNIKLEFGDEETTYSELYSQINANLPEGEFIGKIDDTYKDTLKVEFNETDGQYHLILNKMIGKIVLDGSETISTTTYAEGAYYHNIINIGLNGTNNDFAMSNYYSYSSSYKNNTCKTAGKGKELVTRDNFDNSTYIAWLGINKPIFYYYLATPYIVDLGIVDMPITYNEITNIFTDSDLLPTINAKYYRNFISTVRNLQVNEKALKQELIDINTRLSALESAQISVASESEVVE